MLNRRFLRIKAFQALYSFSRDEKADASLYKKKMLNGMDKTYELYLFLISFPQELKSFWGQELETESGKFIPSEKQIETYKRLMANQAVAKIENNAGVIDALKLHKINWSNQIDLFRTIWNELKSSDIITSYLAIPEPNFIADKNFLSGLMEWLCVDCEIFETFIEERYSNWEDDQVLALTTLQKTLQMMKENGQKILPEKHKDEEEDMKFVKNLFDLCVEHDRNLMDMIALKTKNWDQDRIALVDLILMKMALCEVLYFPYIPVKVSINEYLELAKLYSTPNSHGFINGVLDKVQIDLRKENKINKLGRGLVD